VTAPRGLRGVTRAALYPAAALVAALAAALPAASQAPASAEEVAGWLAGTFDTKDQAAVDAEAPLLRAVIVRVPKSRLSFGAPVLYREEAPLDRPERPVLQSFLRIEEDASGRVVLREFELKEGAAAAGKWRMPDVLALFGRNDVRERSGCAVALTKTGDHYEGSAAEPGCALPLLGASRTMSEIRLWSDRTETWDRGFNARGEQVWGPRKGPIRWKKSSALPPGDAPPAAKGAER
jgi:CpeT protein